ncbi:MAG: bacillithiol system redox-active protein YtxJ [Chitinophagaceae bacterium]|nr:bacillithiol system redox-active protein YtxJ [Chitinophagaceae bacterium]
MKWNELHHAADLDEMIRISHERSVVIFKHSTRCSISHMAKARLDREEQPPHIDFYLLDLLQHRDISNLISEKFQVYHESPQILLLQKGECIYDESHNGIRMDEILKMTQAESFG